MFVKKSLHIIQFRIQVLFVRIFLIPQNVFIQLDEKVEDNRCPVAVYAATYEPIYVLSCKKRQEKKKEWREREKEKQGRIVGEGGGKRARQARALTRIIFNSNGSIRMNTYF